MSEEQIGIQKRGEEFPFDPANLYNILEQKCQEHPISSIVIKVSF